MIGINQVENSREYTGKISDRRSWTALLFLVLASIATMGTVGCATTGQSAGSKPTTSPNGRTIRTPATPAPNGTTAANGGSTTDSPVATAPNDNTSGSNGSTTSPTAAAAMLSTSASSLNFGNVQVGTSTSQLITLTNNSNSNLIISAISTSGSGFTTTGNSNITMTPNQSVSLYVNFLPTAAGSAAGTVIIASNAMNSMVSVSVSGAGVAPHEATHAVARSWIPSSQNVVGYYVDRSNTAGGPYTRVSASAVPNPAYNDATVASGTYFYVVTAVGSNNTESGYSNEVQAIVP
jgi:hypothetical protein